MLPSGPGRNANTAWPHAFDAEGMPLPAPERARLKAELKGAGRIREHWRGNLHHVDLEPFQERIRSIPTRRGDLLIWHRGCPHGNGYNLRSEPRFAQFVNYSLLPEGEELTAEQMDANRKAWVDAGSPQLTPLGRKAFGLAPW